MPAQFSTDVNNAALDAIEIAIGVSPIVRFYSGAMPANTTLAATGTLLAQGQAGADWLNNAASGEKTIAAAIPVTGLAAAGAGTNIGYFRVFNAAGTSCKMQGDVTVTGGGGVMELVNTSVAFNQVVPIELFTITALSV